MKIRSVGVVTASATLVIAGLTPAEAGGAASGAHGGGTRSSSTSKPAAVAAPTGALTLTATRVDAGPSSAADVIHCHGKYRGKRAYDAPHPGESSDGRKVNAHLSIVCNGGGAWLTLVTVTSRMVDGHRVGAPSSKSRFRAATTGGDLRCLKKKRAYQAKGRVNITFPPGYEPATASAHPRSVIRAFKRAASGQCRRP